MIALKKLIVLPHKEVVHVAPYLTALAGDTPIRAVRFEGDERHRSSFTNRNDILGALSVERAFDIGLASETNLFLGRCL